MPSLHPSRPSADLHRTFIEGELTPGKRTDVRSKALKRDNNRCLVTGAVEYNSKPPPLDTQQVAITEACHIIPFHLVNVGKTGAITQDIPEQGTSVQARPSGRSDKEQAKVGPLYVYH